MLRLRVLSATAGVPILLLVAIAGGAWYVGLVLVGAILSALEVCSMLRLAGFRPLTPLGVVLAVGLVLAALTTDVRVLLPAILLGTMLVGILWMMARPEPTGALVDWALTLAGAVYVGSTMHYFVPLRALPDGLLWILLVLVCTWVCDIAAFFVGRRWGKARLAPRLSPGKSVEGAIGGLIGAVLTAMVLGLALAMPLGVTGLDPLSLFGLLRLAGLGLVIGVCAIVGDLIESFVKRQCGAKDSGATIPGHGGVLDRIDSVILAVVGAYFFVVTTS